jgi:hypothetical protein
MGYYGGLVPLQHRDAPRLWLSVYRVKQDFVPLTTYSPQVLADWARTRGRPLPPAAVAALIRTTRQVDPESAAVVLKAIRDSGPDALAAALLEPDAEIRSWAATALGELGPSARSAKSALQKCAADDPSAQVREAAKKALIRIGPSLH